MASGTGFERRWNGGFLERFANRGDRLRVGADGPREGAVLIVDAPAGKHLCAGRERHPLRRARP